jgi:hypothetical protein
MSTLTGLISAGGGGGFTTESISTVQDIPSGTSADVTISCPSGKKLRLVKFGNRGGLQSGVTITVGSKTVISSAGLDDFANDGESLNRFIIGGYIGGSTHDFIVGDTDEDIVFSFDASTTQTIRYAYQVGV